MFFWGVSKGPCNASAEVSCSCPRYILPSGVKLSPTRTTNSETWLQLVRTDGRCLRFLSPSNQFLRNSTPRLFSSVRPARYLSVPSSFSYLGTFLALPLQTSRLPLVLQQVRLRTRVSTLCWHGRIVSVLAAMSCIYFDMLKELHSCI